MACGPSAFEFENVLRRNRGTARPGGGEKQAVWWGTAEHETRGIIEDGRADTIGIALSAWEDAPMPSVRSSIPGRSGPCGRPRPRTHRPILSPLTRTVKLGCSLTSTVHCRRYPLYRWLCHFAIFPSCAPGGSHDGPLSYRDREFPCYMRHKVRAY